MMELGPNTLREFDGIGEVAFFADGDYARPRQRNFPAVDALLKVRKKGEGKKFLVIGNLMAIESLLYLIC
jgi:hypothetical protein